MARITDKTLLENGWKTTSTHDLFYKDNWVIVEVSISGEWILVNTKDQSFEVEISLMRELEYVIENYGEEEHLV